jgi:branched-chain amino acid transport system substrate-binding protein
MPHATCPRSRLLLSVFLSGLLLTACGTRVTREETIQGLGAAGRVETGQVADGAAGTDSGPAVAGGAAEPGTPLTSTGGTTGSGARPGTSGPGQAAPGGAVVPGAGAVAAGCKTAGKPVVIGQVGTFSGVLGPTLANSNTALKVWAQWVNARGGVGCRQVRVYSVDDGGDASKASAAVKDLVENKKAVAIVGAMAPLTINSLQSYAESKKVPIVGGDNASANWTSSPMLFPAGTTADGYITGLAKIAVQAGGAKMALFYCVETSICTNVEKRLVDGGLAKKNGVDIVYNASTSLVQSSFVSQCQAAQQAGAKSILIAMDGSSAARVGRDCASLGYRPQLLAPLLALSDQQKRDAKLQGLLTSSGTVLWTDTSTQGARDLQNAFKQYAPSVPLTAFPAQAWAAAQLFAQAVSKSGVAPGTALTSADVLAGLGKVKGETLGGLTAPITFTLGRPAPTQLCSFIVQIKGESWSTSSARPLC